MSALPSPARISQALSHVAEAGLGTAMLYELIEVRGVLACRNKCSSLPATAVSLNRGYGSRILNVCRHSFSSCSGKA